MGIFDRFRPTKIEAQNAPQIMSENWQIAPLSTANVSRADAISVPSIARAASLIKGIVASTPLEVYRDATGEEVENTPAWVKQPSPAQPRSVTMAWTVDSLIFYGQAFWQVTSVSEFDGRPLSFEWIPNSRVTFNTDLYTEFVTQYYIRLCLHMYVIMQLHDYIRKLGQGVGLLLFLKCQILFHHPIKFAF